jgi:hypothetical protein
LSAARAIAQFQFYANDPERQKWWMQKTATIYLDELYSSFIPTYYPMIQNRPGKHYKLVKLKPSCRIFQDYPSIEAPAKSPIWLVCAERAAKEIWYSLKH